MVVSNISGLFISWAGRWVKEHREVKLYREVKFIFLALAFGGDQTC